MTQRQIFAIGGKFYVEPWEAPLLQLQLLSLSAKAEPRICLLAGASGDNPTSVEIFYRQMNERACRPFHLNMYHPVTRDFADYFGAMDIIYVGGGATKNLVSVWKDWGIDVALRGAWEAGVVLSGTSAGAICWFEGCITDSYPPEMLPLECLGFLKGSASSHYSARADRAPAMRRLIADGTLPGPGLGLDDHCAAHFIGTELHEFVTADARAAAHRVDRVADGHVETRLPARLLTAGGAAGR